MNAVERLAAADHLVSLIATCIRLRHPKAAKMVPVTLGVCLSLNDAALHVLTERLESWIRDQKPALVAPRSGD